MNQNIIIKAELIPWGCRVPINGILNIPEPERNLPKTCIVCKFVDTFNTFRQILVVDSPMAYIVNTYNMDKLRKKG